MMSLPSPEPVCLSTDSGLLRARSSASCGFQRTHQLRVLLETGLCVFCFCNFSLSSVRVFPCCFRCSVLVYEKEMATLSSVLARETPRTEEPGGLQSTGSKGVSGS